MRDFSIEKRGYNKNEVNKYIIEKERHTDDLVKRINELENDKKSYIETLENYKNNEEVISKSIILAVKAGNVIEENSKALYVAEIEKIKKLYDKWTKFLNNISTMYPDAIICQSADLILKSLSDAIDAVLNNSTMTDNKRTIISSKQSGQSDNFENIIVRKKCPSKDVLDMDKFEKEYKKETKRLDLKFLEKNLEKYSNKSNEEILHDLIKENKEVAFGYEKEENKESCFDLKEAINPSMELEDIMKTFNLD